MRQLLRKLFLMFVSLSGLLFVACAGGKGLQPLTQGSTIPPSYNPNTSVTDNCNPNQLNVSIAPSSSNAGTNESVTWSVTASGCTGAYKISGPGIAPTSFIGSTSFTKSYSVANTYTESITVESYNSLGQTLKSATASGTISVSATTITSSLFRCNIVNPSGGFGIPSISIPVNAQGQFLQAPDFNMLLDASAPANVVAIYTPPPGLLYYYPDLALIPELAPGSPAAVRLTLNTIGYSYVVVRVANKANLNQTAECASIFEVKTTAPVALPPPTPTVFPPTVNLLAQGQETSNVNPLQVVSGASVSLSWTSVHATSCSLSDGGPAVTVPVGSSSYSVLNITSAKTFTLTCLNGTLSVSDSVYVSVPPAPTSHLMFVSIQRYNGGLGGLAGADQKCNDMAAAATSTLGAYASRPWKAVLAAGTVKIPDRLTSFGTIFNNRYTSGAATREVVATSIGAMFNGGILLNAIRYGQDGSSVGGTDDTNDEDTWSGVDEGDPDKMNGEAGNRTCANWTNNGSAQMGWVGSAGQGDDAAQRGEWLADDADVTCNQTRHIYCISQ